MRREESRTDPFAGDRFRYGGHMYLWTDRWSDEALWLIEHVRTLGLTLFEVSLGDDAVFTPSRLRRQVEQTGLEITIGPGGVWPMEADISHDDPDCRALGLAWHKHIIDLAADCGAIAYCGAAYGHPGRVMRRIPPDDEYPRTAENLHRLAEYGERAGVLLTIEPMSRFRTHIAN